MLGASSYAPYWTMRSTALAREVRGWAVTPPTDRQREAVHRAVCAVRAEIQRITASR